jgi:hypothetical protein
MNIWQNSIIARVSRLVLWMAGSALLVLLALSGLYALAPLNYQETQLKFFLCLFLLFLFEIAFVTLTISFNCWINLKLSPPERETPISSVTQDNQLLDWPEQEKVKTEQYA